MPWPVAGLIGILIGVAGTCGAVLFLTRHLSRR